MSNQAIETTPVQECIICTAVSNESALKRIQRQDSVVARFWHFIVDIFTEER